MRISEYFLVLSVFEIYTNAILYVFCDLVCIFLKLYILKFVRIISVVW